MAYDVSVKQSAIKLRKAGYSIKDIAHKLKIAPSSSSLWVREVNIPKMGLARLQKHNEFKRYKMSQVWNLKRNRQQQYYKKIGENIIRSTTMSRNHQKILCAMLFWAEGSKEINHIGFTNSDPLMITTFLILLRQSFLLDESKFHVSVHLHEYHDPSTILSYWSDLTHIPLNQFIRPYLKPHTSTRKKPNYMGCITVRYYDHKIARELTAIYNALGEKFRGVVQGQDSSLQKK